MVVRLCMPLRLWSARSKCHSYHSTNFRCAAHTTCTTGPEVQLAATGTIMLLIPALSPATMRSLTATKRSYCHTLTAKTRTAAARRLVYSVSHAEQHDKPGHPEAAARIAAIEQTLAHQHFKNQLQVVSGKSMDAQAVMCSLELVHPAGYLQRLQEICSSLQVCQAATSSTKNTCNAKRMEQRHPTVNAEGQAVFVTCACCRSQPWWMKAPTYARALL
jgi:hypothetical protein